jgi:ketosteroid isomerase-like protein
MALSSEDLLAIQGLVARYNHAIDTGDSEAYVATFSKEGVLSWPERELEGHEALGQLAKSIPSPRQHRHITTNLVIDGDGDKATLKAYLQVYSLSGDPAQMVVTGSGKYDDTLTKADGSWKFVHRGYTPDSGYTPES